MNKNQLRKVLKPLIKECIKEVIFEEGTLSTIISEVVKGTSSSQIVVKENTHNDNSERFEQKRKQLLEQKRKVLDAIGKDAYNGVDLFEGTIPMARSEGSSSPHGSKALDGIDPRDPGVDISQFGMSKQIWKKLAGK